MSGLGRQRNFKDLSKWNPAIPYSFECFLEARCFKDAGLILLCFH